MFRKIAIAFILSLFVLAGVVLSGFDEALAIMITYYIAGAFVLSGIGMWLSSMWSDAKSEIGHRAIDQFVNESQQ